MGLTNPRLHAQVLACHIGTGLHGGAVPKVHHDAAKIKEQSARPATERASPAVNSQRWKSQIYPVSALGLCRQRKDCGKHQLRRRLTRAGQFAFSIPFARLFVFRARLNRIRHCNFNRKWWSNTESGRQQHTLAEINARWRG